MFKIVFLILTFLTTNAFAASYKIPSGADAGVISSNLRKETFSETKKTAIPQKSHINAVPEESKKISLKLKKIKVDGNSVFCNEELAKLTNGLINKKIKLSKIYELANDLTRLYQEKGYVLSFAYVPEQDIENGGNVHIKAVEGFIDDVKFKGVRNGRQSLHDAWKQRLTSSKPLRQQDLESVLVTMNNMPGLTVDSTLSAGKSKNSSNLIIDIEYKKVDGSLSVNNFGNEYVGEFQQAGSVSANSLLGLNERISLKEITSDKIDRLKNADISVNVPLTSYGTMFNVGYYVTNTKPKTELNYEVTGLSEGLNFGLSQPLKTSNNINAAVSAGLKIGKNRNKVNNQKISDIKLSVASLSFQASANDDAFGGSSKFIASVNKGLKAFGSTEKRSVDLGDEEKNPEFTRFNFLFQKRQPITNGVNLQANFSGQFSDDLLPSSQSFSVGGSGSGKGYESSVISADSGLHAMLELNSMLPVSEMKMLKAVQAFAYVEGSWAKKNATKAETKQTRELYSAGLGLRNYLANNIYLNLEVAFPLRKVNNFQDEALKKKTQYYANINFSF